LERRLAPPLNAPISLSGTGFVVCFVAFAVNRAPAPP
jgi:hypothetical protein